MVSNTLNCPYCKKKIVLTDSIIRPIEEEMRKNLEKDIIKDVETKLALELKEKDEEIREKNEELEDAHKIESDLRKERRELEKAKKNLELDVERRMDEERKKIEEETIKNADAQHKLKDLVKDKLIQNLKGQIDDMKRTAGQGSQQLQGEVFEIEIEQQLRDNFPLDEIEPVPKGISGADVIQKVCLKSGRHCGLIIWELKNTKNWSNNWIQKLRDDQRKMKADLAVIVTTALPDGVANFTFSEGVFISDHQSFIPVASILRYQLAEVARAKQSSVGRNEKMDMLYNYLIGTEFKQKVEGIIEASINMQREFDQEKRAIQNLWAKREKQLQRAITSTVEMYGGIHGIIGASMPEIKALGLKELPAGDETEDNKES